LPPGRQAEAPIREPGDLPSGLVDATNTARGARWMIWRTEVFWSSLAPAFGYART